MPNDPKYKVEYGQPPTSRRFGQTGGNPRGKGRKKDARNVSVILEEALSARITVKDGARGERKISKLDDSLTQLANKAATGDLRAIQLVKRLTYPDLKRAAQEQAEFHCADVVLIEDKVSGISLIQDLVSDGFYKAQAIIPKGEKGLRLRGVSGMFENGLVLVPDIAPWLEEYIHELISFPGRHDDQVDSTTQALMWIREAGIDPPIIRFCKEELAKKERERKEPTIRLRSPRKASCTVILSDRKIWADVDGYVTVTEEDAGPLRLSKFERDGIRA